MQAMCFEEQIICLSSQKIPIFGRFVSMFSQKGVLCQTPGTSGQVDPRSLLFHLP